MTNTILIVEDDPDIAECLEYNLRLARLQTILARTGAQGLVASQDAENPPGLVLLDLNLPDIDGLEICRQLRARPETSRIPIIMLTAYSSEADRAVGLQSGANNYISKPYSMRELLALVQEALTASTDLLQCQTRLP